MVYYGPNPYFVYLAEWRFKRVGINFKVSCSIKCEKNHCRRDIFTEKSDRYFRKRQTKREQHRKNSRKQTSNSIIHKKNNILWWASFSLSYPEYFLRFIWFCMILIFGNEKSNSNHLCIRFASKDRQSFCFLCLIFIFISLPLIKHVQLSDMCYWLNILLAGMQFQDKSSVWTNFQRNFEQHFNSNFN